MGDLFTNAGTPWHGTARGTRRFMARLGTENHGTENLGTARHGKSWNGKKWHGMARTNIIKMFFLFENVSGSKNQIVFHKMQISSSSHSHTYLTYMGR